MRLMEGESEHCVNLHEDIRLEEEYDGVRYSDVRYLVMDYCNGMTIENFIEYRNNSECRLSEEEARLVIEKLCQGVSKIHEKNITHRDIHYKNVMLHFPVLEPAEENLQYNVIDETRREMKTMQRKYCMDLT